MSNFFHTEIQSPYDIEEAQGVWIEIAREWIEAFPSNERNLVRKALFDERIAAWKFALPIIKYDRVLQLGGFYHSVGLSLSKTSKKVIIYDSNNDQIRLIQRINSSKGIKNIIPVKGEDSTQMPFSSNSFDLIILNGLNHFNPVFRFSWEQKWDEKILREIRRVLKPDGIFYLGFENPYRYEQFLTSYNIMEKNKLKNISKFIAFLIKAKMTQNQKGKSFGKPLKENARMIKKGGFLKTKVYAVVPDWRSPKEIKPLGNSILNSGTEFLNIKEKAKKIFNQSPLFAPAYGIVAGSKKMEDAFYEKLFKNIKEDLIHLDRKRFSGLRKPKGFSVRGTQTVKIISCSRTKKEGVVIRIPLTSGAYLRRKNAHFVLTKIREDFSQAGFMIDKTPEPLLCGDIENIPYFVESIVDGRPAKISESNPISEKSYLDAASLIEKCHLVSGFVVEMDKHYYKETFGELMKRLASFDPRPKSRERINNLEKWIFHLICGTRIPLVWIHGDYKLDNCLLDSNGGISGVVDWELSRFKGLPLFDLLHLWVSKRRNLEKVNNTKIFKDLLKGIILKNFPHTTFLKYVSSLQIKSSQLIPLTVGYWAHNIVHNIDPLKFTDPPWMKETFYGPLELFEEYCLKMNKGLS